MFFEKDDISLAVVVITYSLDAEFYSTLASVLRQRCVPEEVVVVSKEASEMEQWVYDVCRDKNILLKFDSGEDKGIANAFNIALSKVESSFVNFLNAGDCYYNDSSLMLAKSKFNSLIEWLVFRRLDNKDGIVAPQKGFMLSATFFDFVAGRVYLSHQAIFYRTTTIRLLGGFDESYMTLGMDFELNVRFWVRTPPVIFADPMVVYDMGGISSQRFVDTLLVKLVVAYKVQVPILKKIPILVFSVYRLLLGCLAKMLK